MAMLDGKPKMKSGGNVQREKFASGGGGKDRTDPKVKGPAPEKAGGEATTEITHHGDGTHTAVHSDGETSEHPSMGHLAMHMHAKHGDGEAMHVHKHESGVTTHHVGMDGAVEGPHDHGSTDEAAEHMKSMLGEDGGNGAMEMSDGMSPEDAMPSLY
jgi:hypothetical protein